MRTHTQMHTCIYTDTHTHAVWPVATDLLKFKYKTKYSVENNPAPFNYFILSYTQKSAKYAGEMQRVSENDW